MNLNSQYMSKTENWDSENKKIRNLLNYPLYFRSLYCFVYIKMVKKIKENICVFGRNHKTRIIERGFKNDCPNPSGNV